MSQICARVPNTIHLLEILGELPLLHKVQARATLGQSPKAALEGRHVLLLFARYVEGDTFTFDMVHNLRNVSVHPSLMHAVM